MPNPPTEWKDTPLNRLKRDLDTVSDHPRATYVRVEVIDLDALIHQVEHAPLDAVRLERAWADVEMEDERVGVLNRGRFIDRLIERYNARD